MKKSHAIRHRKLAARRRESVPTPTPRAARHRKADAYRPLDRGGGPLPPPAFGGGRYMALAAARMLGARP